MKILLVADVHYTLRQWDWLNKVAGNFDLVVIAGDLLDIASMVPIDAQIVVTRKYLYRFGRSSTLLVTSGNHDVISGRDPARKSAKWLQLERKNRCFVDGDPFEHSGLFFSLIPWWESPDDVASIESQLDEQSRSAVGKRWIWVYHPPPKASPLAWNGRYDHGDDILPRWIERYSPAMILGGHVHQAPFIRDGAWIDERNGTWLFNSGRQPGPIPTFTVIDTELNRAVWVSAEEVQQADLKTPLLCRPFEGPLEF